MKKFVVITALIIFGLCLALGGILLGLFLLANVVNVGSGRDRNIQQDFNFINDDLLTDEEKVNNILNLTLGEYGYESDVSNKKITLKTDKTETVPTLIEDYIYFSDIAFRLESVETIELIKVNNVDTKYGTNDEERIVVLIMEKSEFIKYKWDNISKIQIKELNDSWKAQVGITIFDEYMYITPETIPSDS